MSLAGNFPVKDDDEHKPLHSVSAFIQNKNDVIYIIKTNG